jgi:hypothetical protein
MVAGQIVQQVVAAFLFSIGQQSSADGTDGHPVGFGVDDGSSLAVLHMKPEY